MRRTSILDILCCWKCHGCMVEGLLERASTSADCPQSLSTVVVWLEGLSRYLAMIPDSFSIYAECRLKRSLSIHWP